jgi:hypothetical protein
MSPADVIATDAICPQCRTGMVHVAVTPHPVMRNMQRNTFACYSCKRTRLPTRSLSIMISKFVGIP